MRLRVMSDLHLEFMADGTASFVESVAAAGPECDVLVLAGDVAPAHAGLELALRRFCSLFPRVVFVAGNHEYYGSSPLEVDRLRDALSSELDGLFWLDGHRVTISARGEVRTFAGTTMWYPPGGPRGWMNDLFCIRNFDPWVYRKSEVERRWLAESVRAGDVVVTHLLPHPACVHPRYRGMASNHYFLVDQTALIEESHPALWVHGHTHESVDVVVSRWAPFASQSDTRIVCNPLGYFGHETNPRWEPGLLVEV